MMESKLKELQLKKAMLWANIEEKSQVSSSTFEEFGKTEAEIMKIKKELTKQTKIFSNEK